MEKGLKLVLLAKDILIILSVVGVSGGSRQLVGQCAASFRLAPARCMGWWGKVG